MPEEDRNKLADTFRVVEAAMTQNLKGLEASIAPALRQALKRSRKSNPVMLGGACPGLSNERGAVVVTLASPGRIAILKYRGDGIMEDALAGTTIPAPAFGPEPIEDQKKAADLGHQMAIDSVRDLRSEPGCDPDRALRGWTIVTGLVAWRGKTIETASACALIEDTPLH